MLIPEKDLQTSDVARAQRPDIRNAINGASLRRIMQHLRGVHSAALRQACIQRQIALAGRRAHANDDVGGAQIGPRKALRECVEGDLLAIRVSDHVSTL